MKVCCWILSCICLCSNVLAETATAYVAPPVRIIRPKPTVVKPVAKKNIPKPLIIGAAALAGILIEPLFQKPTTNDTIRPLEIGFIGKPNFENLWNWREQKAYLYRAPFKPGSQTRSEADPATSHLRRNLKPLFLSVDEEDEYEFGANQFDESVTGELTRISNLSDATQIILKVQDNRQPLNIAINIPKADRDFFGGYLGRKLPFQLTVLSRWEISRTPENAPFSKFWYLSELYPKERGAYFVQIYHKAVALKLDRDVVPNQQYLAKKYCDEITHIFSSPEFVNLTEPFTQVEIKHLAAMLDHAQKDLVAARDLHGMLGDFTKLRRHVLHDLLFTHRIEGGLLPNNAKEDLAELYSSTPVVILNRLKEQFEKNFEEVGKGLSPQAVVIYHRLLQVAMTQEGEDKAINQVIWRTRILMTFGLENPSYFKAWLTYQSLKPEAQNMD